MTVRARMLVAVIGLTAIPGVGLWAQTPTSVAPSCPTMELSVVSDKSDGSTGRNVATAQSRLVLLAEKPLLTMVDFTDANVTLTEGQIVLNVSTTAEGSKRVQSFTASNVGKMIVFVVNGRVTNTLKVLDPITGNGFLLGPFLREEAEKLAESINHRGSGCG